LSAPRILQIDAGNSGAKWRLVADGRVAKRGSAGLHDDAELETLRRHAHAADELWLASVLGPAEDAALLSALAMEGGAGVRRARSQAHCAGVTNSYAEPERMGVDRWLALLAARARCSERVCVVDAGTALTIDWLAADGRHEGGYIIPGPALMEAALFAGTGRVRASDAGDWTPAPGTSTAAAVGSGINLALAGALREALRRDGRIGDTPDAAPALLVTGGYGREILKVLGLRADYAPDLVFEGLEIAIREAAW
jgi:type III pantothenate kinase